MTNPAGALWPRGAPAGEKIRPGEGMLSAPGKLKKPL